MAQGRKGSKNIDRAAVMALLREAPRHASSIGDKLDYQADSVRRHLAAIAPEGTVARDPLTGLWELGPLVLAGAAGSSRINSGLFDGYLRMRAAASDRRQSPTPSPERLIPSSPKKIMEQLAEQMVAVCGRAAGNLPRVKAIAIAVPFGVHGSDAQLIAGDIDGGKSAQSFLMGCLKSSGIDLPWDDLAWSWTSDVGAEAVFDYADAHWDDDPRPLLAVKLSRNVRCSILVGGRPVPGVRGEVSDLSSLPVPDGAGGMTILGDALSLERLFASIDNDYGGDLHAAIVATSAWTDAEIFDLVFRPILDRPDDIGQCAKATFRQAGRTVGYALTGVITALAPRRVLLTGFLMRDGEYLREGIGEACRAHRDEGVLFEPGSGIEAETRGHVTDGDALDATSPPIESARLPHQYRVAAGVARIAFADHILPTLPFDSP